MKVIKDRRWIGHYVKGQGCSVNQGNKARQAVSESSWHGPQARLGIWGGEGVSFLRGTQGGEDTAPTWRQEEEGLVPGRGLFSQRSRAVVFEWTMVVGGRVGGGRITPYTR